MRRVIMIALAGAAIAAASPASADPTFIDSCDTSFVTIGTGSSAQSAIACVGYYDKNLLAGDIGNSPKDDAATALATLLSGPANDSTPGYIPPYTLDVSTIIDQADKLNDPTPSFHLLDDTIMSGLTVLGVHWGNNGDSTGRSVTAFYLFNLTGSSDNINLGNAGKGASNARLFSTGTPGAVPEPATWAMMLLGFGGIGFSMRRGRKQSGRLLQIA